MNKKTITLAAVIALLFTGIGNLNAGSYGKDAAATAQKTGDTRMETKTTQKPMDIVETAVAAGSFNTLVAAVKAAGLVETLKSAGPFTVFAPTDEAFAKLPKGTVEALLADKAKLTSILTYHVVSGKVMAADVVKLTEAKTVNGQMAKVSAGKDGVMIDGAKVIKTDIVTSNGVIHVIDFVILPKEDAKK
jgi:uncharacterized surface protein with fasciclin (FAS1) repeats